MSVPLLATMAVAGRGGENIAQRKNLRERLDQQVLQAAVMAVERLQQMIRDENASNGDIIKASSLIFDRLDQKNGDGNAAGDYEIVLKEGP